MGAYILRRLLLIVPTLFGIMVINFVLVQFAPGGPVEQIMAQAAGMGMEATANVTASSSMGPTSGSSYTGGDGHGPGNHRGTGKAVRF